MQPIRIIYDDTPESIPVPEELRHRKAEMILWPLEERVADEDSGSKARQPPRRPGSARGKLAIPIP
jgi:hypothetical protein